MLENKCWKCEISDPDKQSPLCDSFIGGKPKIPKGVEIPKCKICGAPLTFMFQIAFPEEHPWAKKSLALFFCTDEYHGKYCIPEFPECELLGANIPREFLQKYDYNFRSIIFDTELGIIRNDYEEKTLHKELMILPAENEVEEDCIFQLGGKPIWIMETDETPARLENIECKLLFQIKEDYTFERLPNATPQKYFNNSVLLEPEYDLFAQDRIYFWGARNEKNLDLYISVQAP